MQQAIEQRHPSRSGYLAKYLAKAYGVTAIHAYALKYLLKSRNEQELAAAVAELKASDRGLFRPVEGEAVVVAFA